jgi:MFS family permease
MTRQQDRWALRRNLFVGLLAGAIGLGTFAWSRALPLSLAMGFLAGMGLILFVATTNTLIQLSTDDQYRGRIMGLYTLMFVGTSPIGSLISGAIAQRFGAPVATSVSAFVLFAGALWMFRRLRVLGLREAATPRMSPAATEKLE